LTDRRGEGGKQTLLTVWTMFAHTGKKTLKKEKGDTGKGIPFIVQKGTSVKKGEEKNRTFCFFK